MIGAISGRRAFASSHRARRSARGEGEQSNAIAVLLVEDNPGDASLCQSLLEATGGAERIELTVAPTLGAALGLLPGIFELVLLDLHLPDGTGLPAVQRVLVAAGNRPVVVLTGLEDELCARACLEAGAQDYVNKNDMDPRVLRRAVDYARARARANELTRRLEHADRLVAMGQIAAGVAHEVRSPVNFVHANTDEIVRRLDELRGVLDEEDAVARRIVPGILDDLGRMLQDNVEGIGRIARLVQEFGTFASSTPEAPRRIDPVELCRRSLALVAPQVRHRALLVSSLAPVPAVCGDPRRLGQVIVNLTLNANQAITPDDTRRHEVRVETSCDDSMVCIAVSDTGCGIPANSLPRLFDPFYSTKPRSEGTGLGLTISLEIVEAMGGFIEVHSTVGQGSRFEVWLPAAAAEPVPAGKRAELALVRPRRRVLLIDDEVLLLRALARVLRRHHDVVEALGGQAALELLRQGEQVDLVLCDLMMPGFDGVDTLAAVQAEFPQLAERFVVLTGGAVTPRTQAFLDRTEVPVVAKPVTLDVLLRAIDDC